MDTSSSKFQLIHELVSREDNVLTITELCSIARVSRSGYTTGSTAKISGMNRSGKTAMTLNDLGSLLLTGDMIKEFEGSTCGFCTWIRRFS